MQDFIFKPLHLFFFLLCLPQHEYKFTLLLFQAQNNLKCLTGLEKLERLVTLHLRDNQIDNLDGLSPNMKCLQYLNVRCSAVAQINLLYLFFFFFFTTEVTNDPC